MIKKTFLLLTVGAAVCCMAQTDDGNNEFAPVVQADEFQATAPEAASSTPPAKPVAVGGKNAKKSIEKQSSPQIAEKAQKRGGKQPAQLARQTKKNDIQSPLPAAEHANETIDLRVQHTEAVDPVYAVQKENSRLKRDLRDIRDENRILKNKVNAAKKTKEQKQDQTGWIIAVITIAVLFLGCAGLAVWLWLERIKDKKAAENQAKNSRNELDKQKNLYRESQNESASWQQKYHQQSSELQSCNDKLKNEQKRVEQLEENFQKAEADIKQIQAKADEYCRMTREPQKVIAEKEQQFKLEAETQIQQEKNRLAQIKDEELRVSKAQYEAEYREKSQRLDTQRITLQNDFETKKRQCDIAVAEAEAKIANLKQQHASEIAGKDNALASANAAHEAAINDLKQQHASEIAGKDNALASANAAHEAAINDLQQRHASELAVQKAKADGCYELLSADVVEFFGGVMPQMQDEKSILLTLSQIAAKRRYWETVSQESGVSQMHRFVDDIKVLESQLNGLYSSNPEKRTEWRKKIEVFANEKLLAPHFSLHWAEPGDNVSDNLSNYVVKGVGTEIKSVENAMILHDGKVIAKSVVICG